MFKHILCPVDASEYSQRAVDFACEIAQKYNAKVTLLHAHEMPNLAVLSQYDLNGSYRVELGNQVDAIATELFTKLLKRFENTELLVHTILDKQDPRYSITHHAKTLDCDLIVMGTRGLGSIKSVLLGSVSNYVVHHAKCPVLLIPENE